jgi:REP-associated tyrosine transposase
MTYYERNLPHWHPEGAMLFVTWRLYGSLPVDLARSIRNSKAAPNVRFARAESFLDKSKGGPLWLKIPEIADSTDTAILKGAQQLEQYVLRSYVVMPNHVHILIVPRVPLKRITDGIKGVSARRANELLQRKGKTFWQAESFDHWVRDEAEEAKIHHYIENNPVKAGICRNAADWRWSSASKR